jgi:hypothetical protein
MAKKIRTAEELARATTFRDIQYYELNGVAYAGGFKEPDDPPESGLESYFQALLTKEIIAVRLRLIAYGDSGMYTTDAAAIFILSEPVEPIADKVINAFVQTEVLPVLFPFVRQAMFDTANRIGAEKIVLGLTQSADLAVNLKLRIARDSSQ